MAVIAGVERACATGPSGARQARRDVCVAIIFSSSVAITTSWIRLDGATLDQYDPDVLGGHVGYLPQRVTLFDGTIAENIARLAPAPDDAAVVAAAQKAAAHQMILDLPDGYDTRVSQAGGRLSGGQIQRIGLARALYNDPQILVIDEPDASMREALNKSLRPVLADLKSRGCIVLIFSRQRLSLPMTSGQLLLDGGRLKPFPVPENVTQLSDKKAEKKIATGGGAE
mgnify:CR=1 FL=1